MDGLSHLGNLVNLESLRLGVTVYRGKGYKPENRVPRAELEQHVWKLIKSGAKAGESALPSESWDAEKKPSSTPADAAALRAEAQRLLVQAEQLLQRAAQLLKRAAERAK